MILAVFLVTSIANFSGGTVLLNIEGRTATCQFGATSGNSPTQVAVAAGASKKQIEAALQAALPGSACSVTFASGDSTQLIP